MKHIERVTKKGHRYSIEYRLVGFFKWEWDIAVYSPNALGDWLGLTFGTERALFPKRKMDRILYWYSRHKDGENEG